MTGQTAPMQPLSDEQVQNRLTAYNADGSLDRNLATVKQHAADIIAEEAVATFGEESAQLVLLRYDSKVDANWIGQVAEFGRRLYADKIPVPKFLETRHQFTANVISRMFERFSADQETLEACVQSLQRITNVYTDIILAQIAVLESHDAADRRGRDTDQFERRVSDLVVAPLADSGHYPMQEMPPLTVALVVIIGVLVVRPSGMFGKVHVVRV